MICPRSNWTHTQRQKCPARPGSNLQGSSELTEFCIRRSRRCSAEAAGLVVVDGQPPATCTSLASFRSTPPFENLAFFSMSGEILFSQLPISILPSAEATALGPKRRPSAADRGDAGVNQQREPAREHGEVPWLQGQARRHEQAHEAGEREEDMGQWQPPPPRRCDEADLTHSYFQRWRPQRRVPAAPRRRTKLQYV